MAALQGARRRLAGGSERQTCRQSECRCSQHVGCCFAATRALTLLAVADDQGVRPCYGRCPRDGKSRELRVQQHRRVLRDRFARISAVRLTKCLKMENPPYYCEGPCNVPRPYRRRFFVD